MSSDESDFDEDYVPSENESNQSNEDDESDEEEDGNTSPKSKRQKSDRDDHSKTENAADRQKTEDELWKEFLGETPEKSEAQAGGAEPKRSEPISKPSSLNRSLNTDSPTLTPSSAVVANTSTEVSDIFGESNSLLHDDSQSSDVQSGSEEIATKNGVAPKPLTQARPASSTRPGGVGSLLERIGKDKKVTTLEKSRLDWESYKEKEGISEELSTHNKGKGGFLERKEFLERTDYRQFEKERDLRLSRKRKPMD